MVVNPFFEKTVRIQTDRGHRVIDTGPYAYMRHPGYMDTEFIQIDNSRHFDPNKKKVVNRFMWSSEKSAKVCVSAIYEHKREFAFTPMGKIFCWFGAQIPGLFHFLITRFGTPGADKLDAS